MAERASVSKAGRSSGYNSEECVVSIVEDQSSAYIKLTWTATLGASSQRTCGSADGM